MHQDPFECLSASRAFYGFGTAAVEPFSWGVFRVDGVEDRAASEAALRRMLAEWRIPPEVLVHFVESVDGAYERACRLVPVETLNASEKPGYLGETMLPGVGNLFSNDPQEVERPFLLRLDMLRILLGKFGMVSVPDVAPRGAFAPSFVMDCLRAVAHGWIYHEIGHLLDDRGWIRFDAKEVAGAASDFYGLKLRIADRNRDWFGGNVVELKRAMDGVGADIRAERLGRWMLEDDMGVYFRYLYTIGFYAFDAEAVFDSPLARHRLMLTMLYETGLELAHSYEDAFAIEPHRRFVERRDAFLEQQPFYDFAKLREIMVLYRDRTRIGPFV